MSTERRASAEEDVSDTSVDEIKAEGAPVVLSDVCRL